MSGLRDSISVFRELVVELGGDMRLKVKFEKPVREGFRATYSRDGNEIFQFHVDDGVVRRVEYPRQVDRFDKRGRFERSSLKSDDVRAKITHDDGEYEVELRGPGIVNGGRIFLEDLGFQSHPLGAIPRAVALIKEFLEHDDFRKFGNDRLDFFMDGTNVVHVTEGKGGSARTTQYSN